MVGFVVGGTDVSVGMNVVGDVVNVVVSVMNVVGVVGVVILVVCVYTGFLVVGFVVGVVV